VLKLTKTPKYLDHLKNIDSIQEFLKNSSITKKSLRTKLLALDKFIPFLMNRFKEDYEELKDFDMNAYYEQNTEEETLFKKDLEKKGFYNKLIEKTWIGLKPNVRSQLFMKWVNDTYESDIKGKSTDNKNTYLNYMWRIQGFFSLLGFEYVGNPKNMEKIKSNGFHLSENITYEDVIQLYEKLDNRKYKLILKVIMYCGLNPIDVILIKPKDFERYKKTNYYVLVKTREKTKKKDTQFLIVFHKNFIDEFKEYFETKRIVNFSNGNIEKYKKDTHFYYNEAKREAYFKYDWKKDNNMLLFNGTTSNNVIEAFKYHVEKNNLNSEVMSSSIRRLCFTMIKPIFSLTDSDVYNLFTQHKEGLLTRNYTIDLVDRIIKQEYVEKISEMVLIGNVENYIREIKDYKNGMNRVRELEDTISILLDIVKPKKTRESLERELEEIETTEEGKQRAINIIELDLPNGFELHKNDLEVYIEDLKEDIGKHKKLELLESKFKNI